MSTNLNIGINYVNAALPYISNPTNYILMDLTHDYLIWSDGLADLMTHEPTANELNAAATLIDPLNSVTVGKCLLMDYSHDIGGSYYTHLVNGMGGNSRYVFLFSFDGATATEPQLEVWDDSAHATANKNTLGLGINNNSFIKAVCTTLISPGVNWSGTPLAGSNVLLLNGGNGAFTTPGSLLTNDSYANLKIIIPANYATPAADTFVLTVRYSFF